MKSLLAVLWCIPIIELAIRLPFMDVIATLGKAAGRASHLIQAKVSDHWKEKAMRAYAQATFLATFRLAALLLVVTGLALALIGFLDYMLPGFMPLVTSGTGLGLSLVSAGFYVKLRKLF